MSTTIPAPTSAIDWPNLKFGLVDCNGYAKCVYKDGAWGEVEFVNKSTIEMHIGSVALNYGQSVFEGLKAFRQQDGQVRLFRPHMNAARINHSAAFVAMPPLDESRFLDAVALAVGKNLEFVPPYKPHGASGSLYVRPLFFGSGESLILAAPAEFTFICYVTPTGSLYGSGSVAPAVDAFVIDSFDRAAPLGTGSAKLAGNYAPTFNHANAAKKAGYAITLHLDSKTRENIDEFSTSNFLAIKAQSTGTTTLVVPTSPSILKSITTDSIIIIAESKGWVVEKRVIPFAEVKSGGFSEVAACGTAAAITPVKSITYHTDATTTSKLAIGDGIHAGAVFLDILNELTGIQSGVMADTRGWCWPAGGVVPV